MTEEVEVEGKIAIDLCDVRTPGCSVKVCSSSDKLGRPHGLGS